MKPITLRQALFLCIEALLENKEPPQLYLRDGDSNYHIINEIDVLDDRIRCNDTYWDYYECVMRTEGGVDHKLFVGDK